MTKSSADDEFGSRGHELIKLLLSHLEKGQPLTDEVRSTWVTCLEGVYMAKNKSVATERLFECLNLNFKRGAPHADSAHRVYEIERALLTGKTIDQACEDLLPTLKSGKKRKPPAFDTVRKDYFAYKRKNPADYDLIRDLASSDHATGNESGRNYSLALYLALSRQKPA